MTVVLFTNDESITQNATDVWQDKISVSGPVPEGDYIVWVYAEYSGNSTNRISGIRVLVDGVERAYETYQPPSANAPRGFSTMGLINLSADTHSVQLQYRSETLPQTTTIRRARILVMKH